MTKNGKDKQERQCVDCRKSLTLDQQIYYSKKRGEIAGCSDEANSEDSDCSGDTTSHRTVQLPTFRKCLCLAVQKYIQRQNLKQDPPDGRQLFTK